MRKRRYYALVTVTNNGMETINNIDVLNPDMEAKDTEVKIQCGVGCSMYAMLNKLKSDPVVIKDTIIESGNPAQLKLAYYISNPLTIKSAEVKHTFYSKPDIHRRNDTIQDEYNYLLNEDTSIIIEKLLPKTEIKIYLYTADRKILSNFRNKLEVAMHSIELFR